MRRHALLAVLAVLLAGVSLTHAQSPEGPAVMLGEPVPAQPSAAAKFRTPTAAATKSARAPNALGTPTAVSDAQAPLASGVPTATPMPLPKMVAVQSPPVAPASPPPPPIVAVPPAPVPLAAAPTSPANMLMPVRSAWVQVDYLLWWARGGPTGGPLVTTGGTGVLGAPGTQVLLGDRPMGYGPFSGVQVSGGLPVREGLSVEAGYFYLGQRTFGFSAGSDVNGVPLIARPAIDAQNGTQQAFAVSLPGKRAGTVTVESQLRMDGYEFNLGSTLAQTAAVRFDVLGGFRALDMSEMLSIRDQRTLLTAGALSFNGVPLPAGSQETDFDRFATTNHFYGGQVGGRLGSQTGAFTVSAVAKVALGVTQQSVDIAGGSERFMVGASPLSVPGGFLALPSNIGHHYRSTFSVVPQTGVQVGYQITPCLRATVGYTLIYWTHVARPGNQTERLVNPALVPTGPAFGVGGGPALPSLPSVRESDFWVQGVNFGLALTF